MRRRSAETTHEELLKLNKQVASNPKLVSYAVPSDDDNSMSDGSSEESTESTAFDSIKKLTTAHLFMQNQRLQKKICILSRNLQKSKTGSRQIEEKYEQLRIVQAEKDLDIEDLESRVANIRKLAFTILFCGSIFACVLLQI